MHAAIATPAARQLPRDEDALLRWIVSATAPLTGDDFFHTLMRNLAEAFGLRCAFIAECVDRPVTCVRTLAAHHAVMGGVPSHSRGVAAAILSTARTLGNTLGLGLAGAIFTTALAGRELSNPEYVVEAVKVGFVVGCSLAFVGAITSASQESNTSSMATSSTAPRTGTLTVSKMWLIHQANWDMKFPLRPTRRASSTMACSG